MSESTLTFEQAVKVAINEEIKAYNLYMKTRDRVAASGAKTMLEELALQEMGHRKILENMIKGGDLKKLGAHIPAKSRGIAEFLKTTELSEHATPQEVMIFAMGEEQKALNFYASLKDHFAGTELEELFDKLAAEERGHKIRLEDEYESFFMKEN